MDRALVGFRLCDGAAGRDVVDGEVVVRVLGGGCCGAGCDC